ncbi:MAG: NUDIX domain-containing protein [Natronomonas sp.]
METTRHFVATCYVVCDGATLLHEHERLGMWLPPGGHVDRDELPHETAVRETDEETGLDVELYTDRGPYDTAEVESLPQPFAFLLEDIDHAGDRVVHQHVDFVYVGRAESREVDPVGRGEAPKSAWRWFTPADIEAKRGDLADDVADLALRAIDLVQSTSDSM